jgi:hypothetical protein
MQRRIARSRARCHHAASPRKRQAAREELVKGKSKQRSKPISGAGAHHVIHR